MEFDVVDLLICLVDEGASTSHQRLLMLATVSVIGTTIFVVLIAVLHFVNDIDPIQRPTSEYAVGPTGYLMTLAFVAISVSTWALVIGLGQGLSELARSRLGLGFLGVFGIGVLVAAAFPIDLEGAPQTLHGTIHSINGPLTFLSLIVGINLVSGRLKHDERFQPIHRLASVLALIMIPEFIAGGLAAARETGAGIAQRLLIITFVTWFVIVAARLRSTATRRGAAAGVT
jgi:hypothetical protein